jgi:hypothetical protein
LGGSVTPEEREEIKGDLGRISSGPWELRNPDQFWAGIVTKAVTDWANICGLHDGGQTPESAAANAHFIVAAPERIAAHAGPLDGLHRAPLHGPCEVEGVARG